MPKRFGLKRAQSGGHATHTQVSKFHAIAGSPAEYEAKLERLAHLEEKNTRFEEEEKKLNEQLHAAQIELEAVRELYQGNNQKLREENEQLKKENNLFRRAYEAYTNIFFVLGENKHKFREWIQRGAVIREERRREKERAQQESKKIYQTTRIGKNSPGKTQSKTR